MMHTQKSPAPQAPRARNAGKHGNAVFSSRQTGAFYHQLRTKESVDAMALQLLILTVCRPAEVLHAKWEEFNFAQRVWIIPASRMKNAQEHRVPLSDAVLKILCKLQGLDAVWVFPGALRGMGMGAVLRRMGYAGSVMYTFRSAFRAWAGSQGYPKEMVDVALAGVSMIVALNYRCPDLFERRRALMHDWAVWCMTVQPKQQDIQ
ncbi:MAG: tyrosine-type recombinase/integrase [Azoarcus sp.]|jgi:integrase|nr:tyrosine-type recombinase/integrase [Azoarcus sp.]